MQSKFRFDTFKRILNLPQIMYPHVELSFLIFESQRTEETHRISNLVKGPHFKIHLYQLVNRACIA
jgi:hypothetical protein